jgi:hypothetical protein
MKRKGDVTNNESVHDGEPPPAKRSKTLLPAAEQQTRPVAQRLEIVMDSPVNRRNSKKRPSEDMAHENDPKTPFPLTRKKAKIGLNDEPIRRTGKTIFSFAQMKLIKKTRNNVNISWIRGSRSKTYRH